MRFRVLSCMGGVLFGGRNILWLGASFYLCSGAARMGHSNAAQPRAWVASML